MPTKQQRIADGALAWLRGLGVDVRAVKKRERLAALAMAEYDVAEYAARIAAGNSALAVLRRAARAIRAGDLPARWDDPEFAAQMVRKGFADYQPATAFQAAARAAYNAGRYERAMNSKTATHMVYRTMRDERVRHSHRRLEGVTLPKEHRFWSTHYPPNGWRCRCTVYGVSEAQIDALERRGVRIKRRVPREPVLTHTNRLTGEKQRLPESIEPGWDFNPATRPERLAEMLTRRMRALQDAAERDFLRADERPGG